MLAIATITCIYFVRVLGNDGAPVSNALVSFIEGRAAYTAHTDAQGIASAPPAFQPASAVISAPGYPLAQVTVPNGAGSCEIDVALAAPLLGIVRVATGAPQTLHDLPFAAAALEALTIARLPALGGDSLLSALPGADYTRSNSAFTNFGQLRASFAGAGQNRGLVLVDGFPAQDGFGGQIDWALYPPDDVAGAELLRGAGSALYGAGAVGGVLNLLTFSPPLPGSPADGEFSLASGTHDTNAATVRYRSALGGRASLSVFGKDWRSSYFDFPSDFRSSIDYPAAQSSSSVERLRFKLFGGPSSWDFGASLSADQQQEGRPNYWETRRVAQFNGSYAATSAHASLAASAYRRDGWVINAADTYPTMPGVLRYVQRLPTVEAGAAFAWMVTNDDGDFQARVDQRAVRGSSDQYLPSGALQNSGGGSQWLGGVALQQTIRRPRIEVVFGARADQVTSYYLTKVTQGSSGSYVTTHPPDIGAAAISPRAALRYDVSPNVALRASSGAGFRPPYLNELVRGFQIGSVFFAPNSALIPERSHSYGAGFDVLRSRDRFSLDVSTTRVSDAIAFLTLSSTLQQRANVARTQTDGATFTYAYGVGACTTLRASGTTQYARVTAGPAGIVGKRLAFVPERAADIGVDSKIGKIGAGVEVAYLGQTYADDLNAQPLGTALVVGFKINAPISEGAALTLTGTNVTNRTYLSSQDRLAPPALFTLGISVPLGKSHPSC